MRISEAFEAYEIDELVSEGRSEFTIANYQKARNSLLKSIGEDIPIQLLGYMHVIKWKKDIHDKGLRDSYQAQLLMKLRCLLVYLKKHGFATLDPTEIKIPAFTYRKTPWLTLEELSRFLAAIESPRDKAMFAMQFSAGARISEIRSLNRDSVVNGKALVRGKGKKPEDTPDVLHFDSVALRLLDEYLQTRDDDIPAMFISRQSQRMGLQHCIRLANRYAEKAGIERFDNDGKPRKIGTHVIRHTFASDLLNSGLDLYGVQNQLRHKRVETTQRHYVHVADTRKKPDYDRYHTPTPTP